VGELSIDAEIVVHGAKIVKVVVDKVPHRVRVGLHLVSNDGGPCCRIDHEQVGPALFDALGCLFKGYPEPCVALVGVWSQQGVRVNGHHKGRNNLAQTTASSCFHAGHSTTAFPVPITVP
jgi:hypothetical protein